MWAGGSLEATLKAKLSGSFEDACLLLLKLPFDGYCEKLKKVSAVQPNRIGSGWEQGYSKL